MVDDRGATEPLTLARVPLRSVSGGDRSDCSTMFPDLYFGGCAARQSKRPENALTLARVIESHSSGLKLVA